MRILKFIPFLISIFLTSCSGPTGTESENRKTKLSFITNVSADFWAYAEAGGQAAEREFGDIEVLFRTGDGSTAKQKQIVDDLLVAGAKGIAISPASAKNQIRMINAVSYTHLTLPTNREV